MCHAEVMKMNDNKMWALVKEKPEQGLWLKRVQIPEVGPNDVKIKIHKNAICGTDVHIYQWNEWAQHTIPIGLTAGHEYVGEVVEVGAGVQGFKVGDLVSGEGHITCGKCRNCLEGHKENCKDAKGVGVNRNGAFAEYLVIPASNVWPCNPAIDEELYAIFDPFGNATHTALSYDMLGEDVLITGAGPIGIMAAAIAKFAGARHVVITDMNQYRLDLAAKMGATRCVNLTQEKLTDVMHEIGMTEGFDIGLEMSGSQPGLGYRRQVLHRLFSPRFAYISHRLQSFKNAHRFSLSCLKMPRIQSTDFNIVNQNFPFTCLYLFSDFLSITIFHPAQQVSSHLSAMQVNSL